MSLIPTIEIGKKYLWKPMPNEGDICPQCKASNISVNYNKYEVVIIRQIEGASWDCEDCGHVWPIPSGYYDGVAEDRHWYAVPYTQLFPIEEDNG